MDRIDQNITSQHILNGNASESESEQNQDDDSIKQDIEVDKIQNDKEDDNKQQNAENLSLEEDELDENLNERSQYYDSQEWEDEDVDGGHSPINLPEEEFTDEDDDDEEDYIQQEKIYNICSSGKKTKITSIELYGFSMWNLTALLYLAFLLWCYVPESILHNWGIAYIPNKYFALAVPAWLGVSAWCMVMLYCSTGLIYTHPKHSYFSMQDRHTVLAHPKDIEGPSNPQMAPNVFPEMKMQRGDSAFESNTPEVESPKRMKKPVSTFSLNNGSHTLSSQHLPPNIMVRKKKSAIGTQQSNISNGLQSILKQQKQYKNEWFQNQEQRGLNIDYFAKIPDIAELPITVVNNVLYSGDTNRISNKRV